MSTAGHSYAHFRRALDRGNFESAWAYATDLPKLTLTDALQLTLLAARARPGRYPQLARRWLARLAAENNPSLDQLAWASALLSLAGEGDLTSEAVKEALAGLL